MSAPAGRYVVDVAIGRGVIDAEQALADWEGCDPDLREGDPETGFTLYARSEFGFRFAPAVYRPLEGGGPCSTSK